MNGKISVSEMARSAKQIAAKEGISLEKSIRMLRIAYTNIGFEVELDPPATNGRTALDFTSRIEPKTMPPLRPRPS